MRHDAEPGEAEEYILMGWRRNTFRVFSAVGNIAGYILIMSSNNNNNNNNNNSNDDDDDDDDNSNNL